MMPSALPSSVARPKNGLDIDKWLLTSAPNGRTGLGGQRGAINYAERNARLDTDYARSIDSIGQKELVRQGLGSESKHSWET